MTQTEMESMRAAVSQFLDAQVVDLTVNQAQLRVKDTYGLEHVLLLTPNSDPEPGSPPWFIDNVETNHSETEQTTAQVQFEGSSKWCAWPASWDQPDDPECMADHLLIATQNGVWCRIRFTDSYGSQQVANNNCACGDSGCAGTRDLGKVAR